MKIKGRFAPSPSGRMHLGNIYCALISYLSVKKQAGSWLLRIEDLDRQRCKKEYAGLLLDDLAWLGLNCDEGAKSLSDSDFFQSSRDPFYQNAFNLLEKEKIIYDCFCSRADLFSSSAPHASDGRVIYSGNCKNLSEEEKARLSEIRRPAKRISLPDQEVSFTDGHFGQQKCNLARDLGDFIIRRSDGNFSYQLAVVVDDALMGINQVVRGRDLLSSSHEQIFLYKKLNFPPPAFYHLPLLVNSEGKRLSKRDRDLDMAFFRKEFSPEELIGKIMLLCGFIPRYEKVTLDQAISLFSWEKMPKKDLVVTSQFLQK